MKKLLYCAAALATMFFAGSCQRENFEPAGKGGAVTFTVTAPGELDTRATTIANGLNVNVVHYAVYKTNPNEDYSIDDSGNIDGPLAQGVVPMDNKTASVELDLLQDQAYTILFWAQVSQNLDNSDMTTYGQNQYYSLGDLRNVSVVSTSEDAMKVVANDESRAAFFARKDFEIEKQQNYEVTLYRPFSQLNLGTTKESLEPKQEGQVTGYKIDVLKSEVVVKGIAQTFNLLDGVGVEDTKTDFTFTSFATPAKSDETLSVNEIEYHYVAMNYLFVPGDDKLVDISYKVATDKGTITHDINSVPVKENYRTNIIGNLLTSKTDFEIVVDERFNEPDIKTDYIWGGETQEVTPVQENGVDVYYINNPAQLAWVAKQVNGGVNQFSGDVVRLTCDLDLAGRPWTSIGTTKNHFQGIFEGVALTKTGNTYPTVKNLYIENGEYAGLFGTISNGALLRNFNLKHVRISGTDYLGAVVGQIYTTVENVTVEDAVITAVPYLLADGVTYDGGAKVAGIAGLVGDSATITNCTVKNATFRAYRDMGGIVGTTQKNYATTLTGNTVENLTFIVTSFYTPYKDNDAPGHYAPVRGGKRTNPGDVIENNTGDDIDLHTVMIEASEGAAYDQTNKVYAVTAPQGLASALSGAGAAGAGNHTIKIAGDLDMTSINWTPINVDGYNGADIVTVEGNGATIKGLEAALFAGGFAGGSGIVIKDLTIEDAVMVADNTQGYGAFVNCADSMDEITLINCHLKNSSIITPNDGSAESRIGGLVGWTAGYNNQNDGPVDSHITIQNCSVTGCTIKGAGSIGGICGHAGANAATFTKIENCTVTGNTLVSTDEGGWRVGAIVGTANNGQCEINNVTVSENIISQVGKTAEVWQSELYGRFVPSGTGTLTIDGVAVSATTPVLVNGYTALYTADGEYFIYNLDGFQDLHTFFTERYKNPFDKVFNIAADIDAEGYTWASIWLETGNNNMTGSVINGNGHAIKNLTITGGAMFGGTPNGQYTDVPMTIKNLTIDNADVTAGAHFNAIFWGATYGDVAFENVVVMNSAIEGNCNVGAFVGGTALERTATAMISFKDCAVNETTLTATGASNPDPTGASGFIGRAFANTSLKFEGTNSIDNVTTITNNNGLVGGKVYGYTLHTGTEWVGTGVCDEFENWYGIEPGVAVAKTLADVETALENDEVESVKVVKTVNIEAGEVTIDLNEKDVVGIMHKNDGAVLKNTATLTITNGTISSTAANGGSAIQNVGTMTVENAVLAGAPNANGSWPSYTVNNTGTMTIKDTEITSVHGAIASYGDGAVLTLENCILDMTGIKGFTSHGIYTYNGGKVIVNSGTYINNATDQASTGGSVINGNVEVLGGTFVGRIEAYYGTPVLKGGTFSVKPNEKYIAKDFKAINNGDGTWSVVAE